jgi:hypothetical protein
MGAQEDAYARGMIARGPRPRSTITRARGRAARGPFNADESRFALGSRLMSLRSAFPA